MTKPMTDTELLDVLQKLNDRADHTGLCILRLSIMGRGWRLHETSSNEHGSARTSVRQAIAEFAAIQESSDD